MANLLPKDLQETAWKETRARLLIVGALFALALALVAFACEIPAYAALRPVSEASASTTMPSGAARSLAASRSLLALLPTSAPGATSTAATSTPTEALAAALGERPEGVLVDSISYQPGLLIVGGGATDNDAISAYKTNLDNDPHFASVSIPVSALVGAQGNRFSMTIKGRF